MKTILTPILTALMVIGVSANPEDGTRASSSLGHPTAKANEDESLARLRQEKAALEKRLEEINAELSSIGTGGVRFLGMTLADPTQQAMAQYGLRKESPLPIIVEVSDPSCFSKGMVPYQGCAFWIVEHPANGFLFNKEKSASYFPKTVRDLVEAMVACTATPEEYQKLIERTARAAREYADTLKDKPDERKRFLEIAEWNIPTEEAGKYICRVVYNYPHNAGTMTTSIHFTRQDLEQLRELLRK